MHDWRRRVQPEATPNNKAVHAWQPNDKAALQRMIDPLHNAFRKLPFGFLRSEATTLLCAPSSEVYDRLTSILTNVSIVSGLVLSAIAGAALSPFDPTAFPPEKRLTAEAYNVVAAVTVATQLCVVLYSTFTLYIVISSAHNPTAIYRALVHMAAWIGFFEFMTFLPAMGSFALIILAANLRCSALGGWIVLGVVCALIGMFQASFVYVMCHALPYNAWAWSSMASVGLTWLPKSVEAAARNHGALLLAQAKEGVLGGLDENDDYVIDDDRKVSADEEQLVAWVPKVLQISPMRSQLLVKELCAAGLTRERMIEAAQLPGGFHVLCEILAAHQKELQLRPGDRLALATAAVRASQGVN